MTSQFVHVHREGSRKDRIIWLNSSGETVPACGIVEVVSFNSSTAEYVIQKPTDGGVIYFCNGPVNVSAGKKGESRGFNTGPQEVLVDTLSETAGLTVGPYEDSWSVGRSGSGFLLVTNVYSTGIGSIVEQTVPQSQNFWAITNEDITPAPSVRTGIGGLAERLAFPEGVASLTRTGEVDTVWNHFEHIEILEDTLIRVAFDSNSKRYIIIGADCAPTENLSS